jgi:hypothetical protein
VVVARLGLVGAAAIACALGGCSAQSLAPPRDGGLPSPIAPRPPAQGGAAEAGTRSGALDGGTPVVPGDAEFARPSATTGGTDGPPGPTVSLAPTTVLSATYLLSAEVLAADGDGIYWLLPDNQLWMLPTGFDSPRELGFESTGPPALLTASPGTLVAAGDELYWVANVGTAGGGTRQTIHRTKKSGGDDILVANLQSDSVQGVTVDDQYLYWTQDLLPRDAGSTQILALPRDADPGATPISLVTIGDSSKAFALAVDDQYLYWTAWPTGGSTAYRASLWRGDKAGLMNGTTVGAQFVDLAATFLWPYGGALYFLYDPTPATSAVGRADVAGGVATVPIEPGWLAFFGDCVVSSNAVAGISPQGGAIYAAPLVAASAGAAGVAEVEIAADVAVPPVVGVPGLVFVNGSGQLVAIGPADFRAALASGQP